MLGVKDDATPQEITRAYRQLALECHPDRVPEDLTELRNEAEEQFERISEAFRVLSNPVARQQYDGQLRENQGQTRREKSSRRKSRSEAKRQAHKIARKRAEDEILRRGIKRLQPRAAEGIREGRLKALARKKRLLIAVGIVACLAPFSRYLIQGAWWAQAQAYRLWSRASNVGANGENWWVEDLRLYPVSRIEAIDAPNARGTLRGYIKGLDGCYVIPARGSVVEETAEYARIRIEVQRLGWWNRTRSFMGTCTPDFAPIEAYLEGNTKAWNRVDLVVVDVDMAMERVFVKPSVEGLVNR